MAITKKNFIDNSIFKELEEKYPPVESENGVAYKQKLDYLTFETDFLTSPTIRMLRNQHGAVVIAVIFYLRTEMCKNGWNVRVDEGMYYQTLVQDCSYYCNLDIGITNQIIHDLVNNHEMYVVHDESVEEGKFLTCPQQIYNYEMACQKRQSSRERQKRLRAKRTEQSEQNRTLDLELNQKKEEMPVKECQAGNVEQQDVDDKSVIENVELDNPFGIGTVSSELYN